MSNCCCYKYFKCERRAARGQKEKKGPGIVFHLCQWKFRVVLRSIEKNFIVRVRRFCCWSRGGERKKESMLGHGIVFWITMKILPHISDSNQLRTGGGRSGRSCYSISILHHRFIDTVKHSMRLFTLNAIKSITAPCVSHATRLRGLFRGFWFAYSPPVACFASSPALSAETSRYFCWSIYAKRSLPQIFVRRKEGRRNLEAEFNNFITFWSSKTSSSPPPSMCAHTLDSVSSPRKDPPTRRRVV